MYCRRKVLLRISPTFIESTSTLWIHFEGIENMMNVLWLVEDEATRFGPTVFIRLSFNFGWFKSMLIHTNPSLRCGVLYVIFSALSFFSYMAFLSEKTFQLTCMHLYTKVGEKIRGGGVYIAGDNLLAHT